MASSLLSSWELLPPSILPLRLLRRLLLAFVGVLSPCLFSSATSIVAVNVGRFSWKYTSRANVETFLTCAKRKDAIEVEYRAKHRVPCQRRQDFVFPPAFYPFHARSSFAHSTAIREEMYWLDQIGCFEKHAAAPRIKHGFVARFDRSSLRFT